MAATPLDDADRQRLDKWRGLGRYMLDYYGLDADAPTPDLLDEAFERWFEDPRPKVTPTDFACAFGTLLGDCLAAELEFAWGKVDDEQGQAYCLRAGNGWESYPIAYVWKRVGADDAGEDRYFFTGALDLFSARVPERRTGVVSPRSDWGHPLDPVAVTTPGVAQRRLPVLRVLHVAGPGGWQFYDDVEAPDDVVVIAKDELLELDPSLAQVIDLPVGWEAFRDAAAAAWQRAEVDPDD